MEGLEDLRGLLAEMAGQHAREDGDSGPGLMALGGVGRQEGERVVDLDAPLLGHATREIRADGELDARGAPAAGHLGDEVHTPHCVRGKGPPQEDQEELASAGGGTAPAPRSWRWPGLGKSRA